MERDPTPAKNAIAAIAPWFGSKRTMATDIVAELGSHRAYFEVFAGSMAVLLAKPEASSETVVDLHGDLTNLAKVLAGPDTAIEFYARLSRTLFCEGLFRESVSSLACHNLSSIERAYHYFVVSWMGRNGISGTNIGQKRGAGHSFSVRYTPNGGGSGTRWRSAVESIPAWHHRLRSVSILQKNAFEVLEKIDDVDGVVIYADPPYFAETRTGHDATGGWSRYLHDFEASDHERLAKALARFTRARVVVSYYDSPHLETLYPGWTRRDMTRAKNLANQRRGAAGARAQEVLLINGDSLVRPQEPMLF